MNERPPVRTFKPRRRPLSPGRAELLARLGPAFLLDERGSVLDLDGVFGRPSRAVLDIGIGVGDALVAMAIAQPEFHVIGVDVHTPETVLEYVVAPVGTAVTQLARLARRLQHGRIHAYLAYLAFGAAALAVDTCGATSFVEPPPATATPPNPAPMAAATATAPTSLPLIDVPPHPGPDPPPDLGCDDSREMG